MFVEVVAKLYFYRDKFCKNTTVLVAEQLSASIFDNVSSILSLGKPKNPDFPQDTNIPSLELWTFFYFLLLFQKL